MLRFWLGNGLARWAALAVVMALWIWADWDCAPEVGGPTAPLCALWASGLGPEVTRGLCAALLAASILLIRWAWVSRAMGSRAALAVLLALLWSVVLPVDTAVLLGASMGLLCVAAMVRVLLREERPSAQVSMAHRAGAMVGAGMLFFPALWAFILPPFAALFYRGALRPGAVLAMLCGVAVPWAAGMAASHITGIPHERILPPLTALVPLWHVERIAGFQITGWMTVSLWAVILAVWLIHVLLDRKPRSGRMGPFLLGRAVLRLSAIAAVIGFFCTPHTEGIQMLLGVPVGFSLGRLFEDRAAAKGMRVVVYLLLLGTALVIAQARADWVDLLPVW